MAQAIYDALIGLVVWTALVPFTLLQVVRGRTTFRELAERLGLTRIPPAASPRILVHAVSAGEAMAAGAFIRALADQRPHWSVIVTCGNRDARAIAIALQPHLPAIEAVIALPWDRGTAIRRWLRTLRPSAVVVVEPEIWPNLYRACGALQIPLLLVNGHLSGRDVTRYRAARRFFAQVMSVPAWIGVQTEAERHRFAAIGAPAERIAIAGSLKFDAAIDRHETAIWNAVNAARQAGHLLLIGGSTYPGDEDLLMQTLEQLRGRFPSLRLILAPRHVTRANRVVARGRARGHKVVDTSAIGTAAWDVLVVDRLGELSGLYALADVAVVGGTLTARGGHNVLEAARHGCAIIVGPHVHHIRNVVEGLASVDGIIRLSDVRVDDVRDAVARLLDDEAARRKLGQRAQTYCAQRRGAARSSVEAMLGVVRVPPEMTFTARARSRAQPERRPLGASDGAL